MRDYRQHHQQISEDIDTFLTNHPDAFPCTLFKPVPGEYESADGEHLDAATSLERNERNLRYDPTGTETRIFIVDSTEFGEIPGASDGSGNTENVWEKAATAYILDHAVPVGSVVQWDEYGGEQERRTVTMYVMDVSVVGEAPQIRTAYHLIPFQDDGRAL